MRKVVLLLAALLVLTPVAGADIADEIRTLDGGGNNRDHPTWGKTNTEYLRVARTNYADGIARQSAGRRPGTSATASSTTPPRICSRRTASPSGVSSGGSSWTTRSVCARRQAARARTSPSARPIRSRASRTRWATSRSCARRPRPARGGERSRGSRSTRSRATSTVSASTAEPLTGSSGCARGRWTEGSPTTGRSCCWTAASCPSVAIRVVPVRQRPRWR